MKPIPIVAALAFGAALAACDRPNTAYNNSGRTAAVAGTAAPVPDTASPNVSGAAPSGTAATSGTDEQTSAKILAAMSAEAGLAAADVNVTTTNGAVKLGGQAKSQEQVALAMNIARSQPGVSSVESEITVQ